MMRSKSVLVEHVIPSLTVVPYTGLSATRSTTRSTDVVYGSGLGAAALAAACDGVFTAGAVVSSAQAPSAPSPKRMTIVRASDLRPARAVNGSIVVCLLVVESSTASLVGRR